MVRRVLCVVLPALAMLAYAAVARAEEYSLSYCQRSATCRDPAHTNIGVNGAYVGHDEPAVGFTSSRSGSGGADLTYTIRLPKDPPIRPNQAGTAGTWNFNLRATFWLGFTMCDTESSPNFTNKCTPNSDANARFDSADPSSAHYIGRHPGNAFMELQFYGPGWVPQFDGFGCTATQWCANLTIDSFSSQDNTGLINNDDCLNALPLVGLEPVNWAYVTKNGKSQAPAGPLAISTSADPDKALEPDPRKDLLMNSGDLLRVHLHDTPAGERVDIDDLTTGQHGSMTASKANGFAHVLFQPNAKKCHEEPYAFHPEYDSAVPRGNTWTAHANNVSFSDEIGHFEYCDAIDPDTAACTDPGAGDTTLDDDDQLCLDGANYPGALMIKGCTLDDGDWDGPSYRRDWPGTFRNPFLDRLVHPRPVQFSVPTTRGKPLEHIAFENNLPNIERNEFGTPQPECDAVTGEHCVNPPPGAQFYPIYTTTRVNGTCMFQQGGAHIPGTINTFGGNSATEYGTDVLFVTYPDVGFKPITLAEDFHRDLHGRPC
jgi:hypothetical protein